MEERAVSEGIDLIKEIYSIGVKTNERHSFRIVRNRGQNFFQVVRMFRKNSWPKGEWKARRATPLIGARTFFQLIRILNLHGQEIMDKLLETSDEKFTESQSEFEELQDFTPPGYWPEKQR